MLCPNPHVFLFVSGPLIVCCSMLQMSTLAAVEAWSCVASGVAVLRSSCPVKLAWQETPMFIIFFSMAALLRRQHHASHNVPANNTQVWLCGAQSSCPIYVNKVVWAKSATSVARLVAGQIEPETAEELSTTAALTTIRCGPGAYKLGAFHNSVALRPSLAEPEPETAEEPSTTAALTTIRCGAGALNPKP